jgi:hypothetical protein
MSNQTPYGSSYTPPPNSSTAIISLIAGICGLTIFPFLGSIVAVITGSMAKKEIQGAGGAIGGSGLAQAGIIMGWIGIALGIVGACIGIGFGVCPLILIALGLSTQGGNTLLLPLLTLAL